MMSQGAEAGPGFADYQPAAAVPLMLIESQERANLQNEILEARLEAEDAAGRAIEEPFGQADGEVGDPRRTEIADGKLEDPRRTETFGQADVSQTQPWFPCRWA